MDAKVFLKQWRVNIVEVQMALSNADRPSNLFCCHMFLNATSEKPAHWDTEALEVFESAHSLFGQEMSQVPCDKVVHFIQFNYKPDMKAKEFVTGWRLSMQEVQMSFSPFDRPSALFCYYMFLNAVSANPVCYPWFKTVHVDERDFSFIHLEGVYLDFLEFEDCRHKCFVTGTSIHDQHTTNIETRQCSPGYQPGKVYHVTEMAQYADKMRRESYWDDGLVYYSL